MKEGITMLHQREEEEEEERKKKAYLIIKVPPPKKKKKKMMVGDYTHMLYYKETFFEADISACRSKRVKLLKAQSFSPAEPNLFDELVRSVRVAMMDQSSSVDALRKFMARGRQDFLVSHLPGSFLRHQKDELPDSPSSECLFDEGVLVRLISEYKKDTSLATQSALEKAFSLASKSPVVPEIEGIGFIRSLVFWFLY